MELLLNNCLFHGVTQYLVLVWRGHATPADAWPRVEELDQRPGGGVMMTPSRRIAALRATPHAGPRPARRRCRARHGADRQARESVLSAGLMRAGCAARWPGLAGLRLQASRTVLRLAS